MPCRTGTPFKENRERIQRMKFVVSALLFLFLPQAGEASETADLKARFAAMDQNGDGFLSESEYLKGMAKLEDAETPPDGLDPETADGTHELSMSRKKALIEEMISPVKEMLPYKIDEMTTWTDAYEKDGSLHYTYQIQIDTSGVPAAQKEILKEKTQSMICPQITGTLCAMLKDSLLSHGVDVVAAYNDMKGDAFLTCKIGKADCP